MDEPTEIDRCVTCSMLLTQDEIDCEYLTLECFACHADTESGAGCEDRHHCGRDPGEAEDIYNGD